MRRMVVLAAVLLNALSCIGDRRGRTKVSNGPATDRLPTRLFVTLSTVSILAVLAIAVSAALAQI